MCLGASMYSGASPRALLRCAHEGRVQVLGILGQFLSCGYRPQQRLPQVFMVWFLRGGVDTEYASKELTIQLQIVLVLFFFFFFLLRCSQGLVVLSYA